MPLELVWREDDDSPVLQTLPRGGYASRRNRLADRERRQQHLQQRADRDRVERRAEADGAAEREADASTLSSMPVRTSPTEPPVLAHEAGHQPVARARAEARAEVGRAGDAR